MPFDPSTAAEALTAPPATDADGELRCPQCDYDLRALASDRCPECGLAIDRADLAASRIPWTYRAKMGRVRAYWKTVWLATVRPRRLAMEVARPVSLADAKRFQHVTIVLAFVQCLAVLAVAVGVRDDFTWPGWAALRPGVRLGWMLEATTALVWLVCLWFFFLATMRVASYFFHPRSLPVERQNRAVALSYYACAPLPWMVLPGSGCAIFGYVLWSEQNSMPDAGQRILTLVVLGLSALFLFQLAAWWRSSLVLLKRNTRCGTGRVAALGVTLPISWAALAGLFLGLIPLAFIFVALVILSLN